MIKHKAFIVALVGTLYCAVFVCFLVLPQGQSASAYQLSGPAKTNPHKVKQVKGKVPLIEPLDVGGTTSIVYDPTKPLEPFFRYFTNSYEWILAVAVGIVTLWILICGAAIMTTGDPSKTWKNHIIAAIIGAIVLTFFDVILRLMNAWFFR
ncbi:MAG: hypothetical protein QF741_02415 [Candidatus Peribacteraceae bacterium]|nr:hypothetical protein [Candidatus Peribacteraceae bacterium]MDP7454507.1 hypothetical protein [Candidatus Peribacteraceae bacterium]MDP7646280.1 hypothetical protein [Candidatus Peribacteraceae bacterium]|tara:strand:+ start:39 stop:491 length:453 start_codon:yes stop_codon:yes gene_type:complete